MRRMHALITLLIVLFQGIPVGGNITKFENNSEVAITSLNAPSFDATVNITIPADSYLANATMCVSGLPAENNSSAYPESVIMDLNNITIWSFQKTGFGPLGRQDRFSTDVKQAKLDFTKGGGSSNATIRLPKDAYIQRSVLRLNGSTPPNTTELVGLSGANAGDMFGYSASCAGDVNNDGYEDILIGAPSNSAGGTDAGRAYLYFGGASMDNNPDLIFTGAAIDDRFGCSVSMAGDVNNDRYNDIIIGAWSNDAGGYNAGRAYIFFGGQNMNNVADITLTGGAARDAFGGSVSYAGDVNNDGYDDIIVGAINNNAAGNNTGAAYVYFGGQNMDDTADAMFTGDSDNDSFGRVVSSAGDVNNDGYDDLLISAPQYGATGSQTGRAYIYFGGKTLNNSPDITLSGEGDGDYFGFRGLSGGDINNDSYSDVIVGAHNNNAGGNRAGRAYLYNGGKVMDNITDVTFTGFAANDWFGADAAFAGDVNNDGYGDLIISATGNDSASTNSGVAYIFFGGQSVDTLPDRTYIGPPQHWWFGYTVNRAGDVNNDGYDDFMIAWDNFQNASTDPGYVNIYSLNDPIKGLLDVNISIGSNIIWNKTGYFNGTTMLEDFSQQLNDYLRSAPASGNDSYGNLFVDVPITIRVKSEGNITLNDLAIQYQYNATIPNFAPVLNEYLSVYKNEKDTNGNLTIPLTVNSISAGRTRLYSLNITRDMPPILIQQIKTIEMDEDTSVIRLIDLYQYFQDDIDSNTNLTFSIVNASNSNFVRLFLTTGRYLSADALTGSANDNWTGTVQASVLCADHWGQKTESNPFTIVVKNVNDPPIITSNPNLMVEPGKPYYYNITATDGDNNTLSFNLLKAPLNMTIDSKTGKIQWLQPSEGSFKVDVQVDDGNNGTADQIFFLSIANTGPTITSSPPLSASTGYRYVYNVTAEDPDDDNLTFSLETSIIGMKIDSANGTITWMPAFAGIFSGTVYVSDGELKARQDFTILVTKGNSVPVFVSKPVTAATVGVPYEYYGKASDADGDALEFSIVSGPAGMKVEGSGGKVGWTPGAAGNFSVVLKVTDVKGAEALQEFTIVVLDRVMAKLEISAPSEGQNVRGKVLVSGTAGKGSLEVLGVQVRVDEGPWVNASGTGNWRYSLDTAKLKNGEHVIWARAYDGMDYSDAVNRTITVDNLKAAGKGFIPGFEGIVLVSMMLLAMLLTTWRKRTVWRR
jgi:hypothetical protein